MFIQDFDRQTSHHYPLWQMILLDGQASHATLRLLDYSADRHILVVGYPPHCTDILQGLDVAVFGPLKKHWKKLQSDYA